MNLSTANAIKYLKNKKDKKSKILSEHQEQVLYFEWVHKKMESDNRYELIFAVPNGGLRNIIVAKKLVREGVKKGVSDIFIPIPCGKYHGMFLEMKSKRKGAKLSEQQKEFFKGVSAQSYYAVCCPGFEAAKKATRDYINQ